MSLTLIVVILAVLWFSRHALLGRYRRYTVALLGGPALVAALSWALRDVGAMPQSGLVPTSALALGAGLLVLGTVAAVTAGSRAIVGHYSALTTLAAATAGLSSAGLATVLLRWVPSSEALGLGLVWGFGGAASGLLLLWAHLLHRATKLMPAYQESGTANNFSAQASPSTSYPAASAPPPAHAPVPPQQKEDAGKPAIAPTRSRYTLASMAGMAVLKADLAPVLKMLGTMRDPKAKLPDRNGILLSGPPGGGKSMTAEAIAGELGFAYFKVGVSDITSGWVNASAESLANVVRGAIEAAPSVLFIDEIDAVGGRRDTANRHGEDIKLVNALLQKIDDLRHHRVVLIAATNYVDALDPALIRDGRFDFRIEVPWPDEEARGGIFATLAKTHGLQVAPDVIGRAAKRWERRSPSFIANVAKRLRDMDGVKGSAVSFESIRKADREVSKRAGSLPSKGPSLADLYLLPHVRQAAESIVARLNNWDYLADHGGKPPKGVLLFGPPGTGKTSLVNAMARSLGDWHVFEVKTPSILNDPAEFSKILDRASEHRPAIVFLDEADDLLQDRSGSRYATATNEILKGMDGVMGNVPEVIFVAATNNPQAIDAAAKRSGRFGEKVFLDNFRGEDLTHFIEHYVAANPKLRLDSSITPAALTELIGEAGPADVAGVLTDAVNATFSGQGRRDVQMSDVAAALAAIRSA